MIKFILLKLGEGVPYRTLTHPAPPSLNFRVSPLFYNNKELTVRSQERILREIIPTYNTINEKSLIIFGIKTTSIIEHYF